MKENDIILGCFFDFPLLKFTKLVTHGVVKYAKS